MEHVIPGLQLISATIEVNSQCLHKQLCGNTWLMIEIYSKMIV